MLTAANARPARPPPFGSPALGLLFLSVLPFTWPLGAQAPTDSNASAVSDSLRTISSLDRLISTPLGVRRARESGVDHTIIDVVALVRDRGVVDLADLLQAQVPGLRIVPGSGEAGAGFQIRVRGIQTLTDDRAPIVVLDGMRFEGSEAASFLFPASLRPEDINPADIETIEVLRGAATAALYGPGAANGVLLIHTKRGHRGRPRWDGYVAERLAVIPGGWPANFGGVDADNPDTLLRQGGCTLAHQGAGLCTLDYVQHFNPLEQRSQFATALRQRYGGSVSGGWALADYLVAAELENDGGAYALSDREANRLRALGTAPDAATMHPNTYRRWNVRAAIGVRPVRGLEITIRGSRVSSDQRLAAGSTIGGSTLVAYGLLGRSDTTNDGWATGFLGRPGDLFRLGNLRSADRLLGTAEVRWDPVPLFSLRALAGADQTHQRDSLRGVPISPDDRRSTRTRTLEIAGSLGYDLTPEVRLRTSFGIQRLQRRREHTTVINSNGNILSLLEEERRHSVGSYMQQEIAYRDRLFATVAVRKDHFESGFKPSTYPTLAISWVARDDPSAALGLLRLRGAYGQAGRAPVSPAETERTGNLELGLDTELLGNRLSAEVAYYDMRSDILGARLAPSTQGGDLWFYYPGAQVSNKGVELTLAARLISKTSVAWDATFTAWGNRNRFLKQAGPPSCYGPSVALLQCLVQGTPIGGYVGVPIEAYGDADGDGIIERSEVRLGNAFSWGGTPYPTQGASLTTGLMVGGRWRVSVALEYEGGHSLFNGTAWLRCFSPAVCQEGNDPTTPFAEQARAATVSNTALGYFESAAFLKLREVSMTAYAPRALAATVGARSASVTLTGWNLVTWTGYSGIDPEMGGYSKPTTGGPEGVWDFFTLPQTRSVALRAQFVF